MFEGYGMVTAGRRASLRRDAYGYEGLLVLKVYLRSGKGFLRRGHPPGG